MSVKFGALVKSRCPRCGKGSMFQSNLWGVTGILMHERCPACGLAFLPEAGYYLGAMYVSYGLGVLTILPLGVVLAVVLEWSLAAVIPIVIVAAVICMPVFLRYSRVIWLHLDQAIDPR